MRCRLLLPMCAVSVCLARGWIRRRVRCVRCHSLQPLPNYFGLLFFFSDIPSSCVRNVAPRGAILSTMQGCVDARILWCEVFSTVCDQVDLVLKGRRFHSLFERFVSCVTVVAICIHSWIPKRSHQLKHSGSFSAPPRRELPDMERRVLPCSSIEPICCWGEEGVRMMSHQRNGGRVGERALKRSANY